METLNKRIAFLKKFAVFNHDPAYFQRWFEEAIAKKVMAEEAIPENIASVLFDQQRFQDLVANKVMAEAIELWLIPA